MNYSIEEKVFLIHFAFYVTECKAFKVDRYGDGDVVYVSHQIISAMTHFFHNR